MNKKITSLFLALPLILAGCGGSKPTPTPTPTKDPTKDPTVNPTPTPTPSPTGPHDIDGETVRKYMDGLKKTSKGNHFYFHYLRTAQTAADFNNWDLWVWPYRPIEGQGVRFDWVGRTTASDKMSATGDATIDSLGYVTTEIDLTKTYDGGWNAETKRMGGKTVDYLPADSITDDLQIGTQIVYSESRISGSGFWKNDGGNTFHLLKNYELANDDGSKSYHVFSYEDHAAKPTSTPVVSAGNIDDPFANDDGKNVTYGQDKYKTANWTDKAIQATSDTFLKTAGVGYQIMVSSFADSDGDGFGDIYGIQTKLKYLKDLGVKVLWLTPIQKSDSYHGYDIADYLVVDAKFGSKVSPAGQANNGAVTEDTAKADYKALLDAAHAEGMLVVMDLVLNHTSTTNNWFISSAQLDAATRGYYQWGNNETDKENISEAKYWYPYGDHVYSYYAKFGSSMPELNYAYADTRTAVEVMAKNWCEFGVDGFRMDAVKHIFLEDEIDKDNNDTYISDTGSGINYSSDLTKNLNFWRELNYEVKKSYPNAFFVGENFDGHAYHVAPFYEGFDSLFDFYSYFNLTSHASYFYHGGNLEKDTEDPTATGAYNGAHAASFAGQWNSSGTPYSANSDAELFGNKSKSIKYGSGWNLAGTFDTYNKYRTGGSSASATNGYSMINGAFTSNHDIARAINRIAGTKSNQNGLTQQGVVTDTNYNDLAKYTKLVEAVELMLPGLTWIYYGDELGMTGNFAAGKTAKSGYADLAYRQPMKWKQGGKVGDGSMTTGYKISGAEDPVVWDAINASAKVVDAETQAASTTSHYATIAAFANAKNKDQALINGVYAPYYNDITDQGAQKSVLSFTRTLGSTSYRVVANFGTNAVSLSTGGTLVASSGTASASSVGGVSVALIKLDGTPGGGGDPVGSGFGLKFGDGTTKQGTALSEKDLQGRDQYAIYSCSFKKDDTFSLYDFGNDATWVITIDPYSFGANGDASKVAAYVTKGTNSYTVVKDFTADVYIKIKNNDDQIYFGLK